MGISFDEFLEDLKENIRCEKCGHTGVVITDTKIKVQAGLFDLSVMFTGNQEGLNMGYRCPSCGYRGWVNYDKNTLSVLADSWIANKKRAQKNFRDMMGFD